MNEGYALAQQADRAMVGGGLSRATRNTTVAENIDNRIEQLEEQVARLKAVKEKLSTGSILDVSLDDLQMAMGRY